jgi:hypothetical protein
MKVVMTQTASESLWPIYLYHSDYSQDYAEAFQYEIDRFILEHLSSNPLVSTDERFPHDRFVCRRLGCRLQHRVSAFGLGLPDPG